MNTSDLLQAIYNRLSGEVGGLVNGIYSKVPQADDSGSDADFPYISILPVTVSSSDTKDMNGADALIDINLWSRSTSPLSDFAICDAIYDALQKYSDLPIAGANVIDCRHESTVDLQDPDGKTAHYTMTFRVVYYLT